MAMTHDMRTPRPLGPVGLANAVPALSPVNPETGSPAASRWLHVWHHDARRDLFTQRESLRQRHRGAIETMNAASTVDKVHPDDADYSAQKCACPRCSGRVYRIPRRVVDLLSSMFISVSRYRCRSMECGWEGNLRSKRHLLLIHGPVVSSTNSRVSLAP